MDDGSGSRGAETRRDAPSGVKAWILISFLVAFGLFFWPDRPAWARFVQQLGHASLLSAVWVGLWFVFRHRRPGRG
jgi:hypothetical protein